MNIFSDKENFNIAIETDENLRNSHHGEKLTKHRHGRRNHVNEDVKHESANISLEAVKDFVKKLNTLIDEFTESHQEAIAFLDQMVQGAIIDFLKHMAQELARKNYDIALDLAEEDRINKRLKTEIKCYNIIAKFYEKNNDLLEDKINALEEELNPLEEESNPLEEELNPLQEELNPLEEESNALQEELNPLQEELSPIQEDWNASYQLISEWIRQFLDALEDEVAQKK